MGFIDFITATLIILHNYNLIPDRIILTVILYLIIKGFMFKGDIASMIDLGIAAYLIFAIFNPVTFLSWIIAIYIFQKAIASIIL